jgi:hypothetical protein
VGLNIWEAEHLEDFERKFAPHRAYYAEVYEITPIITAREAQQVLVERMKVTLPKEPEVGQTKVIE